MKPTKQIQQYSAPIMKLTKQIQSYYNIPFLVKVGLRLGLIHPSHYFKRNMEKLEQSIKIINKERSNTQKEIEVLDKESAHYGGLMDKTMDLISIDYNLQNYYNSLQESNRNIVMGDKIDAISRNINNLMSEAEKYKSSFEHAKQRAANFREVHSELRDLGVRTRIMLMNHEYKRPINPNNKQFLNQSLKIIKKQLDEPNSYHDNKNVKEH